MQTTTFSALSSQQTVSHYFPCKNSRCPKTCGSLTIVYNSSLAMSDKPVPAYIMNKPSASGYCRRTRSASTAGIYWTSGQSQAVLMNLSQAGKTAGDALSDGWVVERALAHGS